MESAVYSVEDDIAPAQHIYAGSLDHDLVPNRDERGHAPADNAEAEGGSLSYLFSNQITGDLSLGRSHVVHRDDGGGVEQIKLEAAQVPCITSSPRR